jgi:teichuronic acid biosynthesis glycosyltransferase TuaH
MNFVFVSLQRINTDRESTSTSLARELARQQHNVLYVNSPVDRKDFFLPPTDPFVAAHLEAIKAKTNPLRQLAPNLWVLHPTRSIDSFNWVPSTLLFAQLIKLNNRRLAEDIKPALRELQFDNFILINDKDIFRSFYLEEYLKPRQYIYLDRDYTVGMDYWRRHGQPLEPALMRKADAVLCNSLDFTARARRYNPNSFYIGNGFDATQFSGRHEAPAPADLAAIPGPRIGYVGALITLRLDLNLLLELARARPAWSFVLVGWEDEAFAQSALHSLPNVFFLGRKHTKDVPNYMLHFDVCINPQVLNDITRSNFPLKILEYLALGKPVVATTTNTMTEVFSHDTYLATNTAEFLSQLEQALAEDSPQLAQKRIAFAEQFSWKKVVESIIQHLQNLK